jgi:hypothetical protein
MFFIDVFYGIFSSYCFLPTSLISLISYTPSSVLVSCTEKLSDDCQFVASSPFVSVGLMHLYRSLLEFTELRSKVLASNETATATVNTL